MFHVLVIDHALMKQDDLAAVFVRLKQEAANTVKIVVTAYRDITALESYLADGELYDCLYKPFDFEQLGRLIEQAYAGRFQ
jgi:DNA-binding NtrC family response regulator